MNQREGFVVNVEVAVICGERVLLIRRGERESHAAGLLSLVGGRVETADIGPLTLETAARREVEEEVGMRLTGTLTYVTSSGFSTANGDQVVNVVFVAAIDFEPELLVDANEVAEAAWFMQEEIAGLREVPEWTRDYVVAAFRALGRWRHPAGFWGNSGARRGGFCKP